MPFVDPTAFDIDLSEVSKSVDSTETALLRQSLETPITKVDMKGTPLRKRWPRTTANGLTHEYNQRVSLGGPAGGSFYADGQLPSDGNTKYVRKAKQIKCIGQTGRVTGLMIAAGRAFADQMSLEQLARMTSVLQDEEAALLTADASIPVVVTDTADGSQRIEYLQFDGMDRVIRQEGGNVIDASTFADGSKLGIPLVNTGIQTIYDANGEPTSILCSSREKRFFNEILQSLVRVGGDGVVHVERKLGVSVMYYDSDFGSLPIIPTRYITPDGSQHTHMYVWCEQTPSEKIIEVAVLQELGVQPLAKIDDSERFMVNEYETPICRAPQWQVAYDNLSA